MNWPNAIESASRDESRCELCPLSRVKAGVAVRVKQLCASPELQTRLRELGLGEDQIIKLLTSLRISSVRSATHGWRSASISPN